MNCATHSDTAAVASAVLAGSHSVTNATHDVRGVIYCEACLAARMEGTVPAAGFGSATSSPQTGYQQFMDQGLGVKVQPGPASGPNPAVAGISPDSFPSAWARSTPAQYAKGLSHLVIMVLLILGVSSALPWYVIMVLESQLVFSTSTRSLDSVRSAKAIQLGEPAPDPFGLAQTFGAGEKFEGTKVLSELPF